MFPRRLRRTSVNAKSESPRRTNELNGKPSNGDSRNQSGAGAAGFAFGSRRYASRGPRRLFLAQKCQMGPVFEHEAERPHALLRMQSSCA
jgi:hypothetical protein